MVRVVRGKKEKAEVEHYWLCGECYSENDFHFAADGTVGVERREEHDVAAEIDSWLDPTLVA